MTPANAGVLLVDKPAGVTSHDVVAAVRRLAGTRKVGHAGTLDPAATGLLVLGIGAGTRLLTYLSGLDKDYSATFCLGRQTSTEDADGEVLGTPGIIASDAEIDCALAALTGDIEQVPSAYSAKKIGGVRAYDLARQGKSVKLKAASVRIDRLERTGPVRRSGPLAIFDVEVTCSSGTYVRALARQTALRLDSVGHITALRRHRVGPFHLSEAASMERLSEAASGGAIEPMSLAQAAGQVMEAREVNAAQAEDLRHGRTLAGQVTGPVALVRDGSLIAIGVPRRGGIGPAAVFSS
ncbi:MAG: tRNA pseudouridine(55) synthase TruB [Flaviflexus sp.]|nr:tRNA pseudouridine(55) synthase TruB [Flaviflexus sp.]